MNKRKNSKGFQLILGATLVTILMSGCACPPKYEVYPTLSLTERMKGSEQANYGWWANQFKSEIASMATNEWKPSSKLLNRTYSQVSAEYGVFDTMPDFHNAFMMKYRQVDDPKVKDLSGMLEFIDHEHPNLLVNASRLKPKLEVDEHRLPSLVSMDYPVGVSLTKWTTPTPQDKKPAERDISIIGNTLVVPSDTSMVCIPEGSSLKCKQERTSKDAKEKEGESAKIEDYNPEQQVSLSISTVLNSPVSLDRIEYVSTYLYLEPYPFPPNGGVVLEGEFWRNYLALNSPRDILVQKDAVPNDMCRAIEDMRVHLISIDTTVKPQKLDLGTLTRKTSDKFSADIEGTIAATPALTSLTPKLSYSTGADTEASMKLQQELDQRSTYIDPSGHFLRITQRGMQSINLAGRFIENIKLFVPASQEQFQVLTLNKTKKGERKVIWLAQPLYSRVDALTLSVVVARQATALAKSTKDSFRLDDPKDAAFIAGVTRPYRLTLWQNDRTISEVMTKEIFGNIPKNQKVYFRTFKNERPSALRLYGFTPEQQNELLGEIREAKPNKDGTITLIIDSKNQIDVGLPDDPTNPSKLIGFK